MPLLKVAGLLLQLTYPSWCGTVPFFTLGVFMALLDTQLSWARILGRRGQWEQVTQVLGSTLSETKSNNAAVLYYLSHAYFNLEQYEQALEPNSKAVELEPLNTAWRKRLAATLERCGKHAEASAHWTILSDRQPNSAEWHFRLAKAFLKISKTTDAIDELRLATSLEPSNETYASDLARLLRSRKIYWEEVKLRESSTYEFSPTLEHDYGTALLFMNRPHEAREHFLAALRSNTKNADWAFDTGRAYELTGDLETAQTYYLQAIRHDRKLESAKYGIGVFHEKRGDWYAAADSYKKMADGDITNGDLQYKTGLAFDRCFLWEKASTYYEKAIISDPSIGRWHYKLGLASERTGDWELASKAYHFAGNSFNNPYWFFRSGLAQLELRNYEIAYHEFYASCSAFASKLVPEELESDNDRDYLATLTIRSVPPRNQNRTSWFKNRGLINFRAGRFIDAAQDFRLAIDGARYHDKELFLFLGVCLAKEGEFRSASLALRETRIFKWQDGINVEKMTQDPNAKNLLEYTEYYQSLDIDENQVIWQSNGGESIGCHPLALYEAMLEDPVYSSMRHVWVLNHENSEVPPIVAANPNVAYTRRHSDGYRRALATAKFLVNNATFPGYFIRKEGQNYLNTWHGTPYKTLGKDMKGEPFKHAAFVRDMLQASHLISPNAHTTSVLVDSHDIRGLFSGKLAELGSPRVDRTLNISESRLSEIRKLIGVELGEKVVLYAPTWRGATNSAVTNVDRLQSDLDYLSGLDAKIVFRAHRLEEASLKASSINAIVVPESIDTNELLAAVDLLITDYSSIFFDFLPLERPVIFYMPDQEEYENERGLYLSNDELPGEVTTTIEDAAALVTDFLQDGFSLHQKHQNAKDRFCPSEDGLASGRVLNFWLTNEPSSSEINLQDSKKTILFQQSMIPTGMSASFLNLISKLDSDRFRIVLLVEPRLVIQELGRLETMNRLPSNVQVIGRSGGRVMTPEQSWINSTMEKRYNLPSTLMEERYYESFAQEFKRIFGFAHFDAIVQFDGYVPFWGALLAAGGSAETRRVTYLHNDMEEEWKKRWPNLESIFNQYAKFDKLISVSETMSEINRSNISKPFSIDPTKFVACENVINGSSIISSAGEEMDQDLKGLFLTGDSVFVSSGRLSIEKDHRKLIDAFKKHILRYPKSHLLILGDGPLRAELTGQISSEGLSRYVTLAGRRSNPYPYVKAADCFILPSNHEGQPMVLLEAMVLGKKIIVTDIPGSAHVVRNEFGLIVENSVDGLVRGLQAYESDELPFRAFDWQQYEVETVSSFLTTVGLI